MNEDDSDLETGFKVVAIMQTITEELDESGKRVWRKMLGISSKQSTAPNESSTTESKKQNSEKN